MLAIKLIAVFLPALALGTNSLSPLGERAEAVCVVYAVVEYPCLDTTVTSTRTVTSTIQRVTTVAIASAIPITSSTLSNSLSLAVSDSPSSSKSVPSQGASSPTQTSSSQSASSFQTSASASASSICSNAATPSYVPQSIGGATMVSLQGPAVFNDSGTEYSFGFSETAIGTLAFAVTDTSTVNNDFIYYQLDSAVAPPDTFACSKFGYLYDYNAGLCVTVDKPSDTSPGSDYSGGTISLNQCNTCNKTNVPQNQLFCVGYDDAYVANSQYKFIVFFGDTVATDPPPGGYWYGITYNGGDVSTPAVVDFYGNDGIFLEFPDN